MQHRPTARGKPAQQVGRHARSLRRGARNELDINTLNGKPVRGERFNLD